MINNTEYINSNIDKIIERKGEMIFEVPFISIKNIVPFPSMTVSIPAPTPQNIAAANYAIKNDTYVFLTCDNDFSPIDEIDELSLNGNIGILATVKQIIMPKQSQTAITLDCLCRAIPRSLITVKKYFNVIIAEPVYEKPFDILSGSKAVAHIRIMRSLFQSYSERCHNLDERILEKARNITDGGSLSDFIAQYAYLSNEAKMNLLTKFDPEKRIEALIEILRTETEILDFQDEINEKLQKKLITEQKEHFIREQIKLLKNEIGENYESDDYIYEEKISALNAPADIKEQLMTEASRLLNIPEASQEYAVIASYLDTCLSLPWGHYSDEDFDISEAERILNSEHFGLNKVKNRILETLAVKKLTENSNSQILCLIGPPGIGKTSIGESIARACGRKFERISLGGVHDESEIRGHRKTYIASMPGRIISALIHAKTANPVILLDEVDKLGNDYKGDPASALLEVLDPEQNKTFKDHYVDLPFDLSKVFFIATANVAEEIPEPLLDRMDSIELTSYTHIEKFEIAKRHLVPKQITRHGLTSKNVKIADSALNDIIKFYTREAGVRSLEKNINSVLRKVAKEVVAGKDSEKTTITNKNLKQYLGPKKFKEEIISKKDKVGVVNGLAYTTVGGELLLIEVNVMEGTGKVELTGSLGDVMKESAHAAVSFIRANAKKLGVKPDFYKTKDIHFHFPEGAIPKDGPSAGIGIATALISQLTKKPVCGKIAMTGEITLRGHVLPIGGLREKTMAAYKAGIETVIIPNENLPDIEELETAVREKLNFVPVSEMFNVIETAVVNFKQDEAARN